MSISSGYILSKEIPSGKEYIYDEITSKLDKLDPKQRKTVYDIIDAYIKNVT